MPEPIEVASGPNPALPIDQPIPFPDLSDLHLDPGLTAQAMIHNSMASATAECRINNAKLTADYIMHAWANYVLRMTSGQPLSADMQVPPQPPMAYVVGPPNADGLVEPMVGTTPVCAMPALPTYNGGITKPVLIAGTFDIGMPIKDNPGWFLVGPRDSEPADFRKTIPGPDGNMMTVQKWMSPWGSKYEKVG